jgi:hypothetical protein
MAIYQDDKLVKRAYTKVPYSEAQIDELRKCMNLVTGPEYFISNFMYVQHPVLGKQKLVMYDFQKELLRTYANYRKSINLLGRQLGKCLSSDVKIKIRNKITDEIKEVTFEEFERIIKND